MKYILYCIRILNKRKSLCYRSTMNVSFNRGRHTRVAYVGNAVYL